MTPEIHQWSHEPLAAPIRAALDRLRNTESVRHIAVMPDVHLSHDVCVGTVVATDRLLLPQAVGGDIGCGMAIVALDAGADALESCSVAARILTGLYEHVPIMRRARRHARSLPDHLQQVSLSDPRLEKSKSRDGVLQLGTLGSGNHFLELQADEEDRLWLMVHSGSRGMGQQISAIHLDAARRTETGLRALDATTVSGAGYVHDLEWAVRYAAANRRTMAEAAVGVIGAVLGIAAVEESHVDCSHNYVREEEHFGARLWVHRKGAVSASALEPGIIPGSMGTASFHVQGRGCVHALRSSSHGAGRRLSRSEARHQVTSRRLERQLSGVWFDHRASSRLCEEAPEAYKDIEAVMRAQKELTRVVRRLRPLLCYKGG